jgi:hypothetical protein
MRTDPFHDLSLERDYQPEHAVGGGMLGPHVDVVFFLFDLPDRGMDYFFHT